VDPGRRETSEVLEDLAATRHPENAHAHLRLRGVDADVQGRQSLVDQSLEPARSEVRERDVVAVREGETEIVIAEVERSPHAVRIAIDEAEYALVGTLPDGIRMRDDAERLSRILLDLVEVPFSTL